MKNINRRIREARPSLLSIAPLRARIIQGYIVVNALLGLSLIFDGSITPQKIAIVNDFLTVKIYGAMFIGLSLYKGIAYLRNDWDNMKTGLIMGLLLKAAWMYALLFLAVESGSYIFLVLWIFFAYIQMVTYIYFIPAGLRKDDDK